LLNRTLVAGQRGVPDPACALLNSAVYPASGDGMAWPPQACWTPPIIDENVTHLR
jgi:hypothetical protein